MRVPGYWRTKGWVRSHFKSPNRPGVEQLPLDGEQVVELDIPRQRSAEPVPRRE